MLLGEGLVVGFYQFLGHSSYIGGGPTVRAQPEEEAIMQLLYIPGQDFARAAANRRVRIMRTNMTTLT